jgi:hypothetical protein
MRLLFISVAALLALSGCVSTSGALPIGKDTFSITVGVSDSWSDSENAPKAKKEALTQAGDYCKSLNKEISVQTMSGRSNGKGGSNYDIIFQCLDANDPALKNRPVFTTK